MLEQLKALDTRVFLFLNGKHSAFFDPIMYWASNKLFWFPFYAVLIYLLVRWYKKRSILILVLTGVLITASDQLSSHLIKNLVRRPRPSREPLLAGLVHLSKAGRGGMYGFVSSHAANCFALVVFLCMILDKRYRWLKAILICWALLVSYSRIYVGVHYPGDVLCGALLGAGLGLLMSMVYRWGERRFFSGVR
jgi:undecaprenyl-diphosphatase